MTIQRPAPGRWRILALLSVSELLGMAVWFTASAVSPHLAAQWHLSTAETAWLTGSVQLGFVAGTAVVAIGNVADLVAGRLLFATSAALAGLANASLLVAGGLPAALLGRFATGFFLAGVYPPAMKMIATWFRRARGLAIGTIVGALTVGKALPYLARSFAPSTVIALGSLGALVAGALVLVGFRPGPYPFPRRAFSWGQVVEVVAHRQTRLAIVGYLGHMWELYAMWTWAPAFLGASVAARGDATGLLDVAAFGTIAAGGLGCVWGGWAADRWGRERVVNLSMLLSASCAVGIGALFGCHLGWLVPVAWFWGFFVVADSAQFSAVVTEVAPAHAVGTALTLQTSVGFLLTIATIQLVPELASLFGWRWAFPVLALGPAVGIAAMRRLRSLRAAW